MKLNNILKLIIKILILIILLILIFIISTVLYSIKYWPDIYNYINPNITIKRIPTISEITAEIDFTTDFTTEFDYFDSTTDSYKEIDVFGGNSIEKREVKIDFTGDYSDVPNSVVVDYVFVNEPVSDGDLLVDGEKSRNLKYFGHHQIVEELERNAQLKSEHKDDDLRVISSWIVTIFVKNESKNSQFDYVCDGALVSEQYVLTGARCVLSSNTTFRPEDVIIIVGKKSLQGSSSNEKVIRISAIHIHENFTNENGKVQNELAVLQLEETVVLNEDIQIANLSRELTEDAEKSITTAWSFTGELKTIYYEKYENGSCHDKEAENMFCATYGNEVALCPSYGGLYAVKVEDSWFLQGIRSGDPTERGICFIKRIDYTTLDSYMDWIEEYLE